MFLALVTLSFLSANDVITHPEQTIQAGLSFVAKYEHKTDFEFESAETLVDSLTEIGAHPKHPHQLRSRAYFVIARISWRIADKYRLKGGSEFGRRALRSVKESLHLDPENIDSALSYAKTMSNMVKQNFAIRKILEGQLQISIKREAESAFEHLERLRLFSTDYYPILKEFLEN